MILDERENVIESERNERLLSIVAQLEQERESNAQEIIRMHEQRQILLEQLEKQ